MNNTTLSSYMARSRAKQFSRSVLALLIISGIAAGIFLSRSRWLPVFLTHKPDHNADAGELATAAVSEFYTLNYAEGMEQWAGRVCSLSTAEGCQITKHLFGPLFWDGVTSKKISTSAQVVALEMIYEENLELAQTQVWKLDVTLSNPWEGVEPTQTVYAQVYRATNLEAWQFVRILFEQEVAKLTGQGNEQ